MKAKRLLLLILLLVFAKGLVWSAVVPMWHFPDEQAHFAQVHYLAELLRYPAQVIGLPADLAEEILTSERLLGTERELGINKFTYHPEYRIPYTDTTIGLYEDEIAVLPIETRHHYVKYEAANYPASYYVSLIPAYWLFYDGTLFDRVFASRIWNLFYAVAFAAVVWKIAPFLSPRHVFYQAVFTLFVSFHPMLTFVGSGVTSDNAINLWYAVFLYLGLRLLSNPKSLRTMIVLTLLMLVSPLVKQQSLLMAPVYFFLLGYMVLHRISLTGRAVAALLTLGSFLAGISIFLLTRVNVVKAFVAIPLEYNPALATKSIWFLRWTLEHTIREVFPWYWGVFNWLGVVLPRVTNRIILRIVGIAVIGLAILVIRRLRTGWFREYDKALLFLAGVSIVFFLGITVWDFVFFSQYNYSFGIQGRYFFPTIIAHMALLLWGLRVFIPEKKKHWWPIVLSALALGMIMLNFHALLVVLTSYYSFATWETFFNQVSQYKPGVFKCPPLVIFMVGYAVLLLAVLVRLFPLALGLYRGTQASARR